MSDSSEKTTQLMAAIEERDAATIHSLVMKMEFVLINIRSGEDDEDVTTLTADVDDFDVIVAFTSEKLAGDFVKSMDEIFDDAESVDGIVVEGETMLDYLPEEIGLLINPEDDDSAVVDPELLGEVKAAK